MVHGLVEVGAPVAYGVHRIAIVEEKDGGRGSIARQGLPTGQNRPCQADGQHGGDGAANEQQQELFQPDTRLLVRNTDSSRCIAPHGTVRKRLRLSR